MYYLWFVHLILDLPRLHLSSSADDKKIVSYSHIHLFYNVLHWRHCVSSRRPIYLLIVWLHYCVIHFAYALHMRWQNLVLFPYLYTEPFELVIEIVFHCYTTSPYHKINLLQRPFWGIHFQRLNDAFVLLITLIFLYPQNILISVRWLFEL